MEKFINLLMIIAMISFARLWTITINKEKKLSDEQKIYAKLFGYCICFTFIIGDVYALFENFN